MSRSGEIFRPWRVMSSPVLTMIVRAPGSINSYRPRRSLEAPTPPARAAMVFVFAADIVRGLPYYLVGRLCVEVLQPSLSDGFRMTPVYILRQRRDCQSIATQSPLLLGIAVGIGQLFYVGAHFR